MGKLYVHFVIAPSIPVHLRTYHENNQELILDVDIYYDDTGYNLRFTGVCNFESTTYIYIETSSCKGGQINHNCYHLTRLAICKCFD